MKPYNGPYMNQKGDNMKQFTLTVTCKKCGLKAEHCVEYFSRQSYLSNQDDEVMTRMCIQCGYGWQEKPLNVVEEKEDNQPPIESGLHIPKDRTYQN